MDEAILAVIGGKVDQSEDPILVLSSQIGDV